MDLCFAFRHCSSSKSQLSFSGKGDFGECNHIPSPCKLLIHNWNWNWIKWVREGVNEKKTFSFGHCPNDGGGVYPCSIFLALFLEVHFWSIKRVYFLKNANVLNFLQFFRLLICSILYSIYSILSSKLIFKSWISTSEKRGPSCPNSGHGGGFRWFGQCP